MITKSLFRILMKYLIARTLQRLKLRLTGKAN